MGTFQLGTDFSTRSDRAIGRATLLARQQQCDLLVTHVVERREDDQLDAETAEASSMLRRIASHLEESEGLRCETRLKFGSVAKQLAETAREAGADLTIIGPHRRAFLRDRFSHTTASQIARHAMVPLIAANAVPVGDYRRVLLPTDLGEASRNAAQLARSLPVLKEAELVLLHVFDAEAGEMLGRSLVRGTERHEYLREAADEARASLGKFAGDVGLEGSRLLVCAASGSISTDVLRTAADEEADLILIPRSNKGAIAEAFLGSVTEGVLRESKSDILVVPETG